jgi:hypothetical protein
VSDVSIKRFKDNLVGRNCIGIEKVSIVLALIWPVHMLRYKLCQSFKAALTPSGAGMVAADSSLIYSCIE